ncbi:MAG: hypothetical protein HAW67_05045 [Endozoicomonadaceae bacterium]|nr:hypothetical protein [Endozoicomonadaceae bacterium]
MDEQFFKTTSRSPLSQKLGNPSRSNRSEGLVIDSPIDGKPLAFKEIILEGSDISKKCTKSRFNFRSTKHLNVVALQSLYDDLKGPKINSVKAVAFLNEQGVYELLSGNCRGFCLSKIEGGRFKIWASDKLTDDQQRALAISCDKQEPPKVADVIFSLKDYINNLKNAEISRGIDHRKKPFEINKYMPELELTFERKSSSIYELLKFSELPSALYDLFTFIKHIDYRFLREVQKLRNEVEDFASCIKQVAPISVDIVADEIKDLTKAKQKEIIGVLKLYLKNLSESDKPNEHWSKLAEFQSLELVKCKPMKGKVVLELSKKALSNPEFEEKLALLLKEYG